MGGDILEECWTTKRDPITNQVYPCQWDETASYCPVFMKRDNTTTETWNENDQARCLKEWKNRTLGARLADPGYKTTADGFTPQVPIEYTKAGTLLFCEDLHTTDDYITFIKESREVCEGNNHGLRCFVDAHAINYWEQYITINEFLATNGIYGIALAFVASWTFMFADFIIRGQHMTKQKLYKAFLAAGAGALMIIFVVLLSFLTVYGISSWWGVGLTVITVIGYLMSVGFCVEYTVHIVHRFICAPLELERPADRVDFAMQKVFMPTWMAFATSFSGVACMIPTPSLLVLNYMVVPLLVVAVSTYWYGCFMLPCLLQFFNFPYFFIGPRDVMNTLEEDIELKAEKKNRLAEGGLGQYLSKRHGIDYVAAPADVNAGAPNANTAAPDDRKYSAV